MTIWQLKIEKLIDYGKRQSDIAKFCGTEQSTILALREGTTKNPLYSTGAKIDEMLSVLNIK